MIHSRSFVSGALAVPIILVVAVAVFAGTASVPNTFSPGTTALSAEVNANFAALRDTINANAPRTTVLQSTSSQSDATVSGTYELLYTVGSFTKAQGNTDVVIRYDTHVRQTGAIGDYAEYQIRVDNGNAGFSFTGAVVYMNSTNVYESISRTERFTGLAAGAHDVQIWVRGNCSTLWANWGAFRAQALVVEQFSN